jgi:hypothetical protein
MTLNYHLLLWLLRNLNYHVFLTYPKTPRCHYFRWLLLLQNYLRNLSLLWLLNYHYFH